MLGSPKKPQLAKVVNGLSGANGENGRSKVQTSVRGVKSRRRERASREWEEKEKVGELEMRQKVPRSQPCYTLQCLVRRKVCYSFYYDDRVRERGEKEVEMRWEKATKDVKWSCDE